MSEMTTLKDTINAREGNAYMTIRGRNREAFELSKFTSKIESTVLTKTLLGHRMAQHKITGVEGTGSMTMYFMNSEMLQAAIAYYKSGQFTGFTISVLNEDPQSSVGQQRVALYNVIPKDFPVAYLEESDDPLSFDTDFTFDAIGLLSRFSLPQR